MTDKAITDLGVATSFTAADSLAIRKNGETEDKSLTGTLLQDWVLNSVITDANQLSVHAAGTVYALTNTAATLDFGTTDPTLTLTAAGTYLITCSVTLDYNAATFAAVRTATLKARRTNNTAADLTNGTIALKTEIITTLTYTMERATWSFLYSTSNTDDVIVIQGSLDTVPSAGSLDASAASIIAVRLQQ